MREKFVAMIRDALEPVLKKYVDGIVAVNIEITLKRKEEEPCTTPDQSKPS